MKFKLSLSILLLFAVNFIISVLMYANVMEKAFFINLPYFDSIQLVDTPVITNDNYHTNNLNQIGFFGKPQTIRVPRLNLNLAIDKPIIHGNQWKISNSKTYFMTLGNSKSGLNGDSIVFSSPTYSKFSNLSALAVGDRFTIETDKKYLYTYKITKKIIQNYPYQISPDNSRPVVLIVERLTNDITKGIVIYGQYDSLEKLI